MTHDQCIDALAVGPDFPTSDQWRDSYIYGLRDVFGQDWRNGHTLVKARRDLLKAVERAKDYPARAALIEAKRERRDAA